MKHDSRYSGYFDIDGWPLVFVQANKVYLSVHRYHDTIAWREHNSAKAAQRSASKDSGIAVGFSMGRWDMLTAQEGPNHEIP